MNARDIELCVAKHYDFRANIIVPNISWGLFTYQEVDLLVIRPTGYAIEIEIKVDPYDIKQDKLKGHKHWNKLIKQTYFAVPEKLVEHPDIPEYAGIISVFSYSRAPNYYYCKVIRPAKINKEAVPLTQKQIDKVLHLGCMRIWALKEHIRRTDEFRLLGKKKTTLN